MLNITSSKKELRKFGLLIGIISLIIFFLFQNKVHFIFLISGLILVIFGLFIPILLKPFYFIWMALASIMNWLMTKLILSILFFFLLTPIGLLMRAFGKSFIDIKYNDKKDSFWEIRKVSTNNRDIKENLEKQF